MRKKLINPTNVQEECYNDMFSEYCNQQKVITNFFVDGFQEDFSLPIYDEYEDDYMDSLSEQSVNNLTIFGSFIRKNQIIVHDHNIENKVNSNPIEGNDLPLCFLHLNC